MTDMDAWTTKEKHLYMIFFVAIVTDDAISDADVNALPPRVRTAVRDLFRPDR